MKKYSKHITTENSGVNPSIKGIPPYRYCVKSQFNVTKYLKNPISTLKISNDLDFVKNKKSAKYGKLKTAPALLDALKTSVLKPLDNELQRFCQFINN